MSTDTMPNDIGRYSAVQLARLRFIVFTLRNLVFLVAILAMNYTLMRPSPVDLLYVVSFLLTLILVTLLDKREITSRSVGFLLILGVWMFSFLLASFPYYGEGNVVFELISKIFAITIGIICVFVSMSWNRHHFETFMKVYIVSSAIAATLGTIGFLLQTELLTWDGRAKGFIDDPNMYGTFLLPGVIFCAYFLFHSKRNRLVTIAAMALILLGILLSFSRIAVVAAILCLFAYIFFHDRRRPRRLVITIGSVVLIGTLLFAFASLTSAEFTEKLLDRLTFAKSYDLGEQGRYHRYLLVLPMIIENPLGLGVLQLDKIFPEPIHNIWLSSFVNYGWGGGFSWIFLVCGTVVVSVLNYRRTKNEISIVLLLALFGVIMGATLHEGEHWRQMWLLFGLIWGMDASIFERRPLENGTSQTSPFSPPSASVVARRRVSGVQRNSVGAPMAFQGQMAPRR